jgi:DNA-binding CsgD family transcriptional regulator
MADAVEALGLRYFAYLVVPQKLDEPAELISSYPKTWTTYYLEHQYERVDPVILSAGKRLEPFGWGHNHRDIALSDVQRRLFDEASQFGIRFGYTVPLHGVRTGVAALTVASDEKLPDFDAWVARHRCLLQLMALIFDAHVRRRRICDRTVDGVRLSPRQLECLELASLGNSAWQIGRLLSISQRTATFHLDNAKQKLDVRSTSQAVAKLARSSAGR